MGWTGTRGRGQRDRTLYWCMFQVTIAKVPSLHSLWRSPLYLWALNELMANFNIIKWPHTIPSPTHLQPAHQLNCTNRPPVLLEIICWTMKNSGSGQAFKVLLYVEVTDTQWDLLGSVKNENINETLTDSVNKSMCLSNICTEAINPPKWQRLENVRNKHQCARVCHKPPLSYISHLC